MAVSVVVCPHVDVLYVRTPGEFSGCVCENLIKPAPLCRVYGGKKIHKYRLNQEEGLVSGMFTLSPLCQEQIKPNAAAE